MIRQAVILAAGRGTRIRTTADALPKPLQRVAGLPLLARTILTLRLSGIRHIYIVCGFMADELRAAVSADPYIAATGVELDWVVNRDYDLANGVSLLAVSSLVREPFLLSMADHVYDPRLAELAAAAPVDRADLYLCVDRRIRQVYDIDDATKVLTRADRIVAIGKELSHYDAIDCGVFAVTPALFACLGKAYESRGDCSLSDGVRELATRGRARVLDIGDAFWQDVDTPGALSRAEFLLTHREEPELSFAG